MEATSPRTSSHLPVRVRVTRIIESRYGDDLETIASKGVPPVFAHREGADPLPAKPLIWDNRVSGIDVVETADGDILRLLSDGSQSVPQPGWVLMLTKGDQATGFTWTLYGLPPAQ